MNGGDGGDDRGDKLDGYMEENEEEEDEEEQGEEEEDDDEEEGNGEVPEGKVQEEVDGDEVEEVAEEAKRIRPPAIPPHHRFVCVESGAL